MYFLKRKHGKNEKTKKGEQSLYDYEVLEPFSEFQLDTKHLLDVESLPSEAYEHMKKYKCRGTNGT